MSGRTIGVALGFLLLVHSAYSVIECERHADRHHMKDTAYLAHLELPLDVSAPQIIIETFVGVGVALWSFLPGLADLMKVKLVEHAKEKCLSRRKFDETDVRLNFENFMGNRGKLRKIRLGDTIPQPPKHL